MAFSNTESRPVRSRRDGGHDFRKMVRWRQPLALELIEESSINASSGGMMRGQLVSIVFAFL